MSEVNIEEFLNYLDENYNIKYTNQQKEALLYTKGNILLLAAPGSGKTTVVIGKIANLVINHNVNPESIMAITFSRASAKDMEERFNKLFSDKINKKPRFSTIHSFSMTLINEYAMKNRIRFTVIEDNGPNNKRNILRNCYREVNNEFLTEDKVEDLLTGISYVKNMMLNEGEIKKIKTGIKNFPEVYNKYEEIKRNNKYIDYDDMLTFAYNILKQDKDILSKYQNKYQYIICDEAQDTSKVQHCIIWLLGKNKDTVFFVADDDQSIYGFRGSYPEILKQFSKLYKDTKILYMERNFRSTKNIVELTNNFIKTNRNRYDKNIYTENQVGEEVEIVRFDTEDKELAYIIEEIQDVKEETIGILYRNNISSVTIVNKLIELDIPFYIRDTKINFFKHWILDDIKAFVNLSNDETSFRDLERIYFKTDSYISRKMIDYLRENYKFDISVYEQLLRCPFIELYNQKSIIRLKENIDLIKSKTPYEAIDYIENNMNYLDYLSKSREDECSKTSLKDILEILKEISKGLISFEQLFNKVKSIEEEIEKSRFNKYKSNITLSTIHSSKGLEYDRVYMINLVEGVIPSFESIEEEKKGYENLIEEERRLFYVGMTRARKTLKLINTKEKSSKKVYASRFISEVYKILNPVIKESAYTSLQEYDYNVNIGDYITHKAFGKGIVVDLEGDTIEINFSKLGVKKLLLKTCLENRILVLEK